MNATTVTTPSELEIRVERVFDAPRAHVFSVWTDPQLIPEWWATARSSRRWTSARAARTASAPPTASSRRVPRGRSAGRLVQTFQNHLQTLEFEDLGEQTKLTQTMRFETPEERDTTMQYGVEEGAKSGFMRVDAVLKKIALS